MPNASEPGPNPSARPPDWVDFFLLIAGAYLSSVIQQRLGSGDLWEQIDPDMRRWFAPAVYAAVGPILFWPLFAAWQKTRGRTEPLTNAEILLAVAWLLHLAWLGVHVLSLTSEEQAGVVHCVVRGAVFLFGAMGLCGLVISVNDMRGSRARPWTHQFSIAALLWYVLPAATLIWRQMKHE